MSGALGIDEKYLEETLDSFTKSSKPDSDEKKMADEAKWLRDILQEGIDEEEPLSKVKEEMKKQTSTFPDDQISALISVSGNARTLTNNLKLRLKSLLREMNSISGNDSWNGSEKTGKRSKKNRKKIRIAKKRILAVKITSPKKKQQRRILMIRKKRLKQIKLKQSSKMRR